MFFKINSIELFVLYIISYIFYILVILKFIIILNIFIDVNIEHKILYIESINNILIISLCIYGTIHHNNSFIDIALIISLISFITTIIISKYYNTYLN